MKLSEIEKLAINESTDEFDTVISKIKVKLRTITDAQDILVPGHLIKDIEKTLDEERIPCYVVADDCIAIANTYKELYYYEQKR